MGFGDNEQSSFNSKDGLYNQALFTQIRLNELLALVDKLSINLFSYNENFGLYNYEVVFEALNQIFSNIYGKLTPTERKDTISFQNQIYNLFESKNPYNSIKKKDSQDLILNKKNAYPLKRKLQFYRWKLDDLMEVHELGNPTKTKFNPSNAVIMN